MQAWGLDDLSFETAERVAGSIFRYPKLVRAFNRVAILDQESPKANSLIYRLISTDSEWLFFSENCLNNNLLLEYEPRGRSFRQEFHKLKRDDALRIAFLGLFAYSSEVIFSGTKFKQADILAHGVAVANVSSFIAKKYELCENEFYIGGLLHNLGLLTLVNAYPGEYASALSSLPGTSLQLSDWEIQNLRITHTMVGKSMLEALGFSEAIQLVAAQHHYDGFLSNSLVTSVQIGDSLAHEAGYSLGFGNLPATSIDLAAQALSLDDSDLATAYKLVSGLHERCNSVFESPHQF